MRRGGGSRSSIEATAVASSHYHDGDDKRRGGRIHGAGRKVLATLVPSTLALLLALLFFTDSSSPGVANFLEYASVSIDDEDGIADTEEAGRAPHAAVVAPTATVSVAEDDDKRQHKTADDVPKILHVLWGRPLPTDKTFNGKPRKLDNSTYTGCCDELVELALKSYIANLPQGFVIYLWNTGGFDSVGFISSIGLLLNDEGSGQRISIQARDFDPRVEMEGEDPNLIRIYDSVKASVPRGDFVRYYVMKKYGGSYCDLDGILVKRVPHNGMEPMINLDPSWVKGYQNCTRRESEPGTCTLSNNLWVGFPPNHVIFNTIIDRIASENRTCGGESFYCYGPQFMTKTLMDDAGLNNVEKQLGVEVGPFLRNDEAYEMYERVFVAHIGSGVMGLVGEGLCEASRVYTLFVESLM